MGSQWEAFNCNKLANQRKRLYVKEYTPECEFVTLRGFEIPIQLPVKPKDKDIINYGLPPGKQKFKREVLKSEREWRIMTEEEKIAYGEEQWHKRINGEWWFIKGQPFYIPGNAWFFFNHWTLQKGRLPDFRMEALDYMIVSDFVERDEDCIGKMVIKCRRVGDTEKELCVGYELCTRYAGSNFGMMNMVEKDAKTNYLRAINSHKRMLPWFRPATKGDDAQLNLIFDYLDPILEGEPMPLTSSMSYRPTKLRSYDGWEMRYIHWDEIGKIKASDIDVMAQFDILKETVALQNGSNIVGKIAFTTTVEDMDSGHTVKVCSDIWGRSNPRERDTMNRTTSGLYRYYRDYRFAAKVDEWGFPLIEEAQTIRTARVAALLKTGDLDALSAYKRKFPDELADALSVSEKMCALHPALISAQKAKLDIEKERLANEPWTAGEDRIQMAQAGDLVWVDKFMGDVKWIPNPGGKFLISQHPTKPNARTVHFGKVMPGNAAVYSMGVDPIDHLKGASGGSDFAIAVFRNHDPTAEIDLPMVETDAGAEIQELWRMRTNRFVLTYRYRPYNPRESYEDSLKVAMYYGIPMFAETNKPGITFYFETVQAEYYLAWRHPLIRVGAKRATNPGMATTNSSTQLWVDLLKSHVFQYSETYTHHNQLDDFRNFTGDNTTDCDLVVASGFAILNSKATEASENNKRKSNWDALPFDTY